MMLWKTKGMNQDLSVSAFNPEFSFENMNLRLSTNEGNTLMSWVNERGTVPLKNLATPTPADLVIPGITIGTAVLNGYLVLFTTKVKFVGDNTLYDYICMLKWFNKSTNQLQLTELFKGHLNFDESCPLETLVSYESEDIQKVYWVDGRNQPRVINIAAASVTGGSGVYSGFDFVPEIVYDSSFTASVAQGQNSSGLFAPGVIQYCFTYLNKFGQESNIVWVSPLYYISHADRGASPEDKVSTSFTITITHADANYDYVRIYSIQRTSKDLEPFVKLLDAIPTGASITYTDNGTTGATVDPTVLLFIGGKEIVAGTIADKDGTLFLGDIKQGRSDVSKLQEYYDTNRASLSISFTKDDENTSVKKYTLDPTTGIYSHTNTLLQNSSKTTTFKGGEWYRLGLQLQKKNGEWTEPIFLKDVENTVYPDTNVSGSVKLPYASYSVNISNITGITASDYINVRPVIVHPTIADRTVLCQGVLNPTVFNAVDRKTNSPFAQASWYFRPYGGSEIIGTSITVTHPVTTASDLTPNTKANLDADIPEDYLDDVYVLVCTVASGGLANILSKGSLSATAHYGSARSGSSTGFGAGRYPDRNNDRTQNLDIVFSGVITLTWTENGTSITKYAFISDNKMWAPYGDPTNPEEDSLVYNDNISDISVANDSFKFYSKMQTGKDRYYFFPQMGSSTAHYTFEFYDSQKKYSVDFTPVASTAENFTANGSSEGSYLRFIHYQSLFSRTDLKGNKSDKLDSAKQIEIQGASNIYESPFSTTITYNTPATSVGNFGGNRYKPTDIYTSNRNPFSNTQFFIDQSIVTLNSPDIEFDTDVQNCPTDNLKLYIIGAIPITASASAHSIQTSSNILDTSHNQAESELVTETNSGTFGSSNGVRAHHYGNGELPLNVMYKNASTNCRHLVSEYIWNDVLVTSDSSYDDKITTSKRAYDFLIHPWQRVGSLNNDSRTQDVASSWLKTKRESNLLFSANTEYFSGSFKNYPTSAAVILTENDEVMNYRLPKQGASTSEINYYPNIDKVLFNENGYETLLRTNEEPDVKVNAVTSPISMKYKSTSHAVLGLKSTGNNNIVRILPSANSIGTYINPSSSTTFWGDSLSFSQESINYTPSYNFLWLGELQRTSVTNRFGGNTPSAVRNNKWLIGGETVPLDNGQADIVWTEGDTYYQRYDCLKTYPFTEEDTNQMVEILSFMCETHVNIDGRYDRNRGQVDNTRMRPRNFNLLNPVYSQRNNFFTYRQLDHEGETSQSYPNHVAYSMSKNSTAERDEWTHVTLANILELDGDKGKLNKLTRFNDQLLAFQDTGISQILYNENTAISSTAGVPIEIANSGKVTGKRYLSDTIGCKNKWSMVNTPTGIYFMDDHDKSIYLFNGQLENLSTKFGFNSWCKKEMTGDVWEPSTFKGFLGCYDKQNQDVLFVNYTKALAFSEKIGAFTSFYDYGKGMLKSLEGEGIWLTSSIDNATYKTSLWGHQKGSYGRFFGENKPYWMTLVGNPEPQVDKMFTNLEFRACVDGEGVEITSQQTGPSFGFLLPFDFLECWDEYQHGYAELQDKNGHEAMMHHISDGTAALKMKFRIWRCDIPRDNCAIDSDYSTDSDYSRDSDLGVYRTKVRPLNRIRNTWVYLKLMKKAAEDTVVDDVTTLVNLPRTEVHDMGLGYF